MNRRGNNVNALLVEILIAILLFSLCMTVVLGVFLKAHESSRNAEAMTDAMDAARSLLERLSASDDASALLAEGGFTSAEDGMLWSLADASGFVTQVRFTLEPLPSGTMHLTDVEVLKPGEAEPHTSLRAAHYEEVQ